MAKVKVDLFCFRSLARLGAERIGIVLTVKDRLHPEHSTSAIDARRQQAKYFGE